MLRVVGARRRLNPSGAPEPVAAGAAPLVLL